MTEPELLLVAQLGTAFYFCAAGPQAPTRLSASFFTVTGVRQPPAPGWHWTDTIHPDDRASFVDLWTRADADRTSIDTEVRLTGTDGRDHWYRMRAQAREPGSTLGEVPSWVGVAMDVREERSGATGRLTTQFLATASHELRTPLNALAGWLHVLKLQAQTDLRQWHALAAMERNLLAEKTLIDGLLDVSRLARGAVTIAPVRIDLTALVQDCVANVTPGAIAKGVIVAVEAPAQPVMVTADRLKLEQVVWHLLTNALRYTNHPGEVRIHVGHDERQAWLRVQDSGEGIDATFLPYVFEPFSQRPRIAARAGLGLGLTVVRALVELHGGSISAASDGHGQGAVFEVTLPGAA